MGTEGQARKMLQSEPIQVLGGLVDPKRPSQVDPSETKCIGKVEWTDSSGLGRAGRADWTDPSGPAEWADIEDHEGAQ